MDHLHLHEAGLALKRQDDNLFHQLQTNHNGGYEDYVISQGLDRNGHGVTEAVEKDLNNF